MLIKQHPNMSHLTMSWWPQNEKNISGTGSNDMRSITFCESQNRTILPFQLIYTGKTVRPQPIVDFHDSFSLSYNEKHWRNETEAICFINDVLFMYIKRVKEEKVLPWDQKSLLIIDAFKAQSTAKVDDTLASFGIETVMVPMNMTHLLQPLDLTTNGISK